VSAKLVAVTEHISWPALVALMALGNGTEQTLSGIVRVREVRELGTDIDDVAPDADLPGVGPVTVTEGSHRVAKRGDLVRRERLDGRPLAIFGQRRKWIWLDDDDLPTEFAHAAWGWSDYAVVERHPLCRWEGNDFTHPTGPPSPTEMLGRPAWAVEVAPPPHKPFPLTMVVDAETGIVLHERNDGFGSVVEWTEIAFGAELPDKLFEWDGEVLAPRDHTVEREREMSQRRDWLTSHGVVTPTLALAPDIGLHSWDDDTGSFEGSMQFHLSASLLRRPRSDADWETNTNWPHNYRWSDDTFDWFIGSGEELSQEQVESLRAQLGGIPSDTDQSPSDC
jgi:hypothetical protein